MRPNDRVGRDPVVALLIVAQMRKPRWHVVDAVIFLVSLAIVWLGIVVAGKV